MLSDAPDGKEFLKVGSDLRFHPFAMMKLVNRRTTERVNSISIDGATVRNVLVRDGDYEVWVQDRYSDEYGYALRPDEYVSDEEFDAITLKHRAMQEDTAVTMGDVLAEIETRPAATVLAHLVIALYYAAKSDPAADAETVAALREIMHRHTHHRDLSDPETVQRTLDDALDARDDV